MRIGRAIIVSAVLALGAAGPLAASPAIAAVTAGASAAHVAVAAPSGQPCIFYHT
jgi:hypothetical protein